jgi:hypothetical protein
MDWMLPQAAQETRSFNQQSIGFLKSHRYIVQTSVRQFLSFIKNSQFWFLKEVETVLVSHKNLESGSGSGSSKKKESGFTFENQTWFQSGSG